MKWKDLKNLTPEERREMRRAVAKNTRDQISYLKKIKAEKKEKESMESPSEEQE